MSSSAVVTIRKTGYEYHAKCKDDTYLLIDCDNSDVAVGQIVRSEWMDKLFSKYGTVKIVCEF